MGCSTSKVSSEKPGDPKALASCVVGCKETNGLPTSCFLPCEEEEARLASLRDLGSFRGAADPRFDSITSLVKQIFGVELAFISLIERDELSFASRAGDFPACSARVGSFCEWSLQPLAPTMIIVEDASQDVRFRSNQFVTGPPGICFYAAAPLVATDSGHRYGTLCVVGLKPRRFSAEQYAILEHFAELATRELEREKVLRWQQQLGVRAAGLQQKLLRTFDCFSDGVCLCDCSQAQWPILYANDAWVDQTGVRREAALCGGGFWQLFAARDVRPAGALEHAALAKQPGPAQAAGEQGAEQSARAAAAQQASFLATVDRREKAGQGGSAAAHFNFQFKHSGMAEQLRPGCPHIGIPSFVEAPPVSSSNAPDSPGSVVQQQGATATAAAAPVYYFAVLQRQAPAAPVTEQPGNASPYAGSCSAPAIGAQGPCSSSSQMPVRGGSHPKSLALRDGASFNVRGRASIDSWGRASCESAGSGFPASPSQQLSDLVSEASLTGMRPQVAMFTFSLMKEVILGPLVGSGGFGSCYRGLWHGSRVAVKILKYSLNPEAEHGGAKGPIFEALLSRSLAHPHVVETFDFAVSPQVAVGHTLYQTVWILQAYCNKGTLFDAIEQGLLRGPEGQPNPVAILKTAKDIASAVAYLHSQGIVHGDLNPNNVLLTSSANDLRRFVAQVADFGLSRALDDGVTIHTDSLRTLTHMPPELVQQGTLAPASDAYSFGVILWEMWAGRRAWKGMGTVMILGLLTAARTLEVLELPKDAPAEYQELVQRCLAAEPESRPTFVEILGSVDRQLMAARRLGSPVEA